MLVRVFRMGIYYESFASIVNLIETPVPHGSLREGQAAGAVLTEVEGRLPVLLGHGGGEGADGGERFVPRALEQHAQLRDVGGGDAPERRGRLVGYDEDSAEHAKKVVARERERLRASFEAARKAGFRRYVMFLHCPPTNILEEESGFTRMAEEYCAEQVIYAHSHGKSRFYDSIHGERNGVTYRLVSGDFLNWKPLKILDDSREP